MQKGTEIRFSSALSNRSGACFLPLSAMMFFLLLFVPGLNRAQAQAPSVSYAGPLTITQGGTYSGNYRSTDSNVPVITIQTTQPVIIENCILAGAGDLIDAKNGGSDLVVRNNQGFGLTQSVDNRRHGRFIEVNSGKSVRIEHNYFEHTTGIDIYQWGGPGSLVIRYNKAKNMDGRFRNGGGEYCNFLGINGAFNIAGAEVAWNEVLNEPNQSLVEDNINLYNSSGTSNSPFRLHDNYVQGAYPYPATGSNYTGSGITMDGDGSSAGTTTAYVDGYGNQLVSTCAAMNIAAGHDNHFHDNRMVTSGLLPDGSKMPAGYAAAGLWNAYQQPGSVFYNNDFNNNTIGFYYQGGNTPYANRQDTSPGACNPCSNTNHLPDRPLTLDDEKYEWTLWQQKLQQNGITLGTGSNTPPPSNTPPTVSLSVPATGTVGTALTLSATAADADGTVAKVEFFSGATKLGEDLTSPYALSYTPTAAATMSFSARATDNAGAATSSAASSVSISATAPAGGGGTAPPTGTPANATFLRALNVGGGTATIDGKTWEDGTTAANFQINGGAFSNQTVTLSPATDAARATMIRSSVYNPALSATVSNVTNGTYFVYLYMWEDNNPETYDISVEGQVVKSGYNSGAAGHWDRLGPFTANVTDTNISIATTGGDANLSGIEIWKQSTTTPSNTPPTASLTAPATGTVNTALTLSATAADADGTVAKVEFFSGATKLGEDLTSPYSLSWTPTTAGTFSLTARATDNAGAATNSAAVSVTVSATAPAATAGFYRAINVNGSAVSLDGNSWQGSTATNYTTNGAGFSNQNVALNPATTTARAGMIRSSVYTNALSFKMTSVPNGTYDVYLYVWEDNNPETFSIAVNGVAAVSNFNSGSAGSWKKLGPYAATVTAGTISITSTGGTINLSGVEVWRKSTSTALVLPTATEAAATAKATASASAYPASLANSLALNGVAPQAATMQAATLNQGGTTVRSALVRAARGASAKQPASQALPADQYYLRYTNSSLAGPPKGSIS